VGDKNAPGVPKLRRSGHVERSGQALAPRKAT